MSGVYAANSHDLADLLRLSMANGLGPILARRAIETLGSPRAVLGASQRDLQTIEGVGAGKAERIFRSIRESDGQVEDEIARARAAGVVHVPYTSSAYPELLRQIPSPPLVLRVRGDVGAINAAPCVGVVGSRSCSVYGIEQTERFSAFLAECGLTVVSGGARGIDTAAHRAATRVSGRTCVVMGCGLDHCYPPENSELFDEVVARGGAVISELPMRVGPSAENFPARNRIISGLSLGVLVVEAGRKSGALITARLAAEDHGREVMAIPGRIDSGASTGALELLRDGGAAMVLSPQDVIDLLETPARHVHRGTHEARYAPGGGNGPVGNGQLGDGAGAPPPPPVPTGGGAPPPPVKPTLVELTPTQKTLVEALVEPRSLDELVRVTGLEAHVVRAEATLLELKRVVERKGQALALRGRQSRR